MRVLVFTTTPRPAQQHGDVRVEFHALGEADCARSLRELLLELTPGPLVDLFVFAAPSLCALPPDVAAAPAATLLLAEGNAADSAAWSALRAAVDAEEHPETFEQLCADAQLETYVDALPPPRQRRALSPLNHALALLHAAAHAFEAKRGGLCLLRAALGALDSAPAEMRDAARRLESVALLAAAHRHPADTPAPELIARASALIPGGLDASTLAEHLQRGPLVGGVDRPPAPTSAPSPPGEWQILGDVAQLEPLVREHLAGLPAEVQLSVSAAAPEALGDEACVLQQLLGAHGPGTRVAGARRIALRLGIELASERGLLCVLGGAERGLDALLLAPNLVLDTALPSALPGTSHALSMLSDALSASDDPRAASLLEAIALGQTFAGASPPPAWLGDGPAALWARAELAHRRGDLVGAEALLRRLYAGAQNEAERQAAGGLLDACRESLVDPRAELTRLFGTAAWPPPAPVGERHAP